MWRYTSAYAVQYMIRPASRTIRHHRLDDRIAQRIPSFFLPLQDFCGNRWLIRFSDICIQCRFRAFVLSEVLVSGVYQTLDRMWRTEFWWWPSAIGIRKIPEWFSWDRSEDGLTCVIEFRLELRWNGHILRRWMVADQTELTEWGIVYGPPLRMEVYQIAEGVAVDVILPLSSVGYKSERRLRCCETI